MSHNIRVAIIGEEEYAPHLVRVILEQQVVPPQNIYLSERDKAAVEAAAGFPVQICESSASAVVNCEVILVCATKREMGTQLVPISQCTQGRTLVAISGSDGVTMDYVQERVVFGTEIIIAHIHRGEDNSLHADYEIGKNVRLFLHQPCRDMVNVLCR